MVLVNLDSRSSLQFDSISDLILMNSTFLLASLASSGLGQLGNGVDVSYPEVNDVALVP